jgi:hypothetical protein
MPQRASGHGDGDYEIQVNVSYIGMIHTGLIQTRSPTYLKIVK